MSYEFVRHSEDRNSLEAWSAFLSAPFVGTSSFIDPRRNSPAFLHWRYFENPMGDILGYTAWHEGMVAGHFSAMPVRYLVRGRLEKGLVAVNLATHPDHRGKGLFLEMARRTFSDAADTGYGLVTAVANGNSYHGFVKYLDFHPLSPLDMYAGYGNMAVDREADYLLRPHWEPEALRWRLANPSLPYTLDRGRWVLAPAGRFGIMMQMRQLSDEEGAIVNLPKGGGRLRVWLGLARGKGCSALLRMPTVVRPVALHLIIKDVRGDRPDFGKGDVFFETIDFDAY